MKHFISVNDPEIVRLLNEGGIGILRTDTLYGVVAKASDESAVQRVYELKERAEHKSPIVLIGNQTQIVDMVSPTLEARLGEVWPGPVSVIIPSTQAPLWIRRGNASVAYRLPNNDELRRLIEQTGPLIAPSANPEGLVPAMNIEQAEAYFGDNVDFYIDGGMVTEAAPSQLIRISNDGEVNRLR